MNHYLHLDSLRTPINSRKIKLIPKKLPKVFFSMKHPVHRFPQSTKGAREHSIFPPSDVTNKLLQRIYERSSEVQSSRGLDYPIQRLNNEVRTILRERGLKDKLQNCNNFISNTYKTDNDERMPILVSLNKDQIKPKLRRLCPLNNQKRNCWHDVLRGKKIQEQNLELLMKFENSSKLDCNGFWNSFKKLESSQKFITEGKNTNSNPNSIISYRESINIFRNEVDNNVINIKDSKKTPNFNVTFGQQLSEVAVKLGGREPKK